MTYEEKWETYFKYINFSDKDSYRIIWIKAQEELGKENTKFDNWLEYQNSIHKNWANTPEQLARWAWSVQQSQINDLEKDFEKLANKLDIQTDNISIKDIRNLVINKLNEVVNNNEKQLDEN